MSGLGADERKKEGAVLEVTQADVEGIGLSDPGLLASALALNLAVLGPATVLL